MQIKIKLPLLLAAATLLGWLGHGVIANAHRPTADGDRKIQCYQDSMHPWIKSAHAGKCTICGMDLTAIYEGDREFSIGTNLVVLSSSGITVVDVQTDTVKRQKLDRSLRVAGTLEADETHKVIVAAPARGRIDALTVKYAGMEVAQGQRLVTLFSPELQQQNRFLFASRLLTQGTSTNATDHNPYAKFDASTGAYQYAGDLLAPQAGVVVERNVYEGQFVLEGDKLLTIVDAAVLWFRFDVYEQQLPWFRIGQTIAVTVPAVPGRKFPAVVSFIEASLDPVTRTVKVRADLKNPMVELSGQAQRLLRFGMYAEGRVQVEARDVVAVPRTAVLFPAGSAYAYVEKAPGNYEQRRLRLGRQGDALWEVLQGLTEGERVVTSGNVLIDAQAQFNQNRQPGLTDLDEIGPEVIPIIAPEPSPAPILSLGSAPGPERASAFSPPSIARNFAVTTPPAGHEKQAAATIIAERNSAQSAAQTAKPPGTDDRARLFPGNTLAESQRPETVPHRVSPRQNNSLLRAAYRDQQQALRSVIIAEAQAQAAPEVSPIAADAVQIFPAVFRSGAALPLADTSVPEPLPVMRLVAAQTDAATSLGKPPTAVSMTNRTPTHREADVVRREVSASMRQMRMEAISNAQRGTNAPPNPANLGPVDPLSPCIALASDISTALAADDLTQVNRCITNLPSALAPMRTQSNPDPHRRQLIQELVKAGQWHPAPDLADARKQFLPFSTAVVELATELRKTAPNFAGLKIYHCPMAPKPGLWVQAEGPLRNPFFGAKMLNCGEEVPAKLESNARPIRTPLDTAAPAR